MNMGCAQTEKVINHVLEIIYLMTGEEYIIMKKSALNKCFLQVSEDLCQTRNSVLEIPADSPVHVRRTRCQPASYITDGLPGDAQREFHDSAFQPPPGAAHVQIKCDDAAMYLSVEEWEYLEHHKEEYDVLIGKNQPCPADGPNVRSSQAGDLSQMDSVQGGYNSNDTLEEIISKDRNSENRFTAPKVSCVRACEINSSPTRESSDNISRQNVTAASWGSAQSRDVSTLQNNLMLNNQSLSSIFIETEIKEEQTNSECAMDDCENRAGRINNADQVDSPSLDRIQNHVSGLLQETFSHNTWTRQEFILDGRQIKTLNVTDSSMENNYTLDFIPEPSFEKLQQIPILDDQQIRMSGFMDSHTLHQVDTFQTKHRLANKRCSVDDQEPKIVEFGDFSKENGHNLRITNVFKDIPHITHTKTELKEQECSTDGHQTKTVDKDCSSESNNAQSSSNIFQNVLGKADRSGKLTNVACIWDETKNVELNDTLVEDSQAFYHPFSDGPKRTCIKTERIDEEHATHEHQTMDKNGSALGCDTSPRKSHGKRKLTYRECSMGSQQIKTEEVHHSTPEDNSSLSTAGHTSNKPSVHVDGHTSIKEPTTLSRNSTGKVQASGKPLKTISCSECGKTFSCNAYLSRHQRLHTGEKPFTCSECGKSFSWMSSLVTHKRTHFGEKPFSCKQCGKRFSDYSGIIKHRRIHTGEKPYSCVMCGEHFAQTYQLIKHQAFHLVEDVAEKSLKGQ